MKLNHFSDNQEFGFSLIEVLVAFSILVIILMSVLESRLNSVRRMEQTGELNQVQDMVRTDIANIRKQALKWQCIQGTACSGLKEDRNNPPRYSNSHCESSSPLSKFPIQTEIAISENIVNKVVRNVEADGQKLIISYTGEINNKPFTTSTSIIPQAMNWCG